MQSPSGPEVVLAGLTCLDIIPTLTPQPDGKRTVFTPCTPVTVGPAVIATGGAVPNTGLALHRLGVPVRLMGKLGDDLFGRAILDILRSHDPALADDMLVSPGEHSSYSIVISPPGQDRAFLHSHGANDSFSADDVRYDRLAIARVFHFGYPSAMRRMYLDGGREMERLLQRVKAQGLTTSLDMSHPDPQSAAGRLDWVAWLQRVLPLVDVFMPTLEEIWFMLEPDRFERLRSEAGEAGVMSHVDRGLLSAVAGRLLDMGVAIAALKLGDQGLYLRTCADGARLAAMGRCAPSDARAWMGRELLAPCFHVHVVGTTGSGDSTIAGFLAGLVRGWDPEATMTLAVAVGACSVEQADAVSGIPGWDALMARLCSDWLRRESRLPLPGWRWDARRALWVGPGNSALETGSTLSAEPWRLPDDIRQVFATKEGTHE
jgi:sugar/nucleoside kinase (ribokinase family)